MSDLTLIRHAAHHPSPKEKSEPIPLRADRATLAKRRWRGVAEDGREFGFDLEEPLPHGTIFLAEGTAHYLLEQNPEDIFEISVTTLEEAARIAWSLGNLHFGVQVLPGSIRVTPDPAVQHLLLREGLAYRRGKALFLPITPGAHPHHHHHHG